MRVATRAARIATLPPVSAPTLVRRRGTRALLAAAAAASGIVLIAGCGSGFGAQAEQKYQPADGVDVTQGSVRVLNALVVAPPDGGDGVVSMTVVNQGTTPDQLTSVTSRQGQVETAPATQIAPQQAVAFSADSSPVWTIRGLTSKPGSYVDLTLNFAQAGVVDVKTVVVPATGFYASITAAPVPSESSGGGSSPGASIVPLSPSAGDTSSGSPTPTTS